jgi:hypothetical protein
MRIAPSPRPPFGLLPRRSVAPVRASFERRPRSIRCTCPLRSFARGRRVNVYTVLSSSRPERYAVCDSTGFVIPISEIERARLLEEPRRSRHSGDLEQEG